MQTSKQPKLRIWTKDELCKFKEYIISNSKQLISNLIINIVVGYMRFRKSRTFFINMGLLLNRKSKLCKSKFQKIERQIYTDFLKLPKEYYDIFCQLRKQKARKVCYDFYIFENKSVGSENHQNSSKRDLNRMSKNMFIQIYF